MGMLTSPLHQTGEAGFFCIFRSDDAIGHDEVTMQLNTLTCSRAKKRLLAVAELRGRSCVLDRRSILYDPPVRLR